MRFQLLAAALAVAFSSPLVLGQGFAPGRIHAVSFQNDGLTIVELSPAGQVVREIPAPSTFILRTLFGPDGYLYVADGNPNENFDHWIYKIDGSGNVAGKIEVKDQTSDFEFVCDGNLIVNSNLNVVEITPAGVPLREVATPGFVRDVLVSPTGHWFAAYSYFGANSGGILEFDPSGTEIRTFGVSEIGPLAALHLARRPSDGAILLWNSSSFAANLHAYDAKGTKGVSASTGASGKAVITPDGILHGVHAANGALPRVGLDLTPKAPLLLDFSPGAIAVSPYRFKARVTGTFQRMGEAPVKVQEAAVLSIWPCAGRLGLQWTDDALKSKDIATLFGSTAWVFEGFETQGASVKDVRLVHGIQAGDRQQSTGTTSIAATVRGKTDVFGFFVPTRVTATIHRGSAAGIFTGSLVTTKLVK